MRKTIVFSALILAVSLGTAHATVVHTFNEHDNGLVPGYGTTVDVSVNVTGEPEWDWLLTTVDVQITTGEYYVHFAAAGMPPPARLFPPSGWAVMSMPEMAYTTHLGGPPMAEHDPGTGFIRPAIPTAASFDVPSNQAFQMEVYDTDTEKDSEFRVLRLTVSDGAAGTIRIQTNYDWSLNTPGGDVIGEWETYTIGEPQVGTPPVPDPDGPYLEEDWTGPLGYNNPLREILLDGSGTAATDGDPILNYTWEITNTYDATKPVTTIDAGEDETFPLTIGMLAADGVLPPNSLIADSYLFLVTLTATDKDGSATSDPPATLFVPEPGSLVLLGLGGLAGLIRRRRRRR